jgi:glutamine amidotransferase
MSATISVVSYGVSNVGSILNMLRKIGASAEAIATPDAVRRATKIILPGIGSFDSGVRALGELHLIEPLRERAKAGATLLGICLGMQLLGEGSEEGELPGLGLLRGHSVRFRPVGDSQLKVPHMGWNQLAPKIESPLLAGLNDARFYFVHSYHLACAEPSDVLATSRHGVEFAAVVHRDTVWGAQFHPEKSHRYGMALLSNFARL